jgi:hypothetical protein
LDLEKKRPTTRGRCEHTTFPVEVLLVGGGKKVAHCPECGRSGPACEGSAEAIAALRGTPYPASPSPTILVAAKLAAGGNTPEYPEERFGKAKGAG